MSISFFCEDVLLPEMNLDLMKKVLKEEVVVRKLKLGSVNYIFCSDEYLLEMNRQFLEHDYYTDVITFDYSEKAIVSGDVFISLDRVQNNSVIFNQTFLNELVRVISHGFLHLLKYNDKEENEILVMRSKEDEIQNKFFQLNS